MNSFYLLSSILRGKWLIDPLFAELQGPLVANLLNYKAEFEKREPDEMVAYAVAVTGESISTARFSYYSGFEKAEKDSVAVIKIKGSLMKDDQDCGPIGMNTIGQIIHAAESSPRISAIVLDIDSPGGTVDGTETLHNIIKNTQKPVVTFVNGLMASAALWIGSAADFVFASTDTDEVGSVGVLLGFMDVQPYWEKQGIKFHTIVANTSPDKVRLWEDLRAGKYDEYKKKVLDVIDEKFMESIRTNRPNVEEKHLTGNVFFARDVLGILVDKIGTIEEAIIKAYELSREGSNEGNEAIEKTRSEMVFSMMYPETKEETNGQGLSGSQAIENKQKIMSKKYQLIQKALSQPDELELEADGSRTFSPDEMDAVENALAGTPNNGLQTALDTANSTIAQHEATIAANEATIAGNNATISERDSRISALEAENASLRGTSAGSAGAARSDNDATQQAGKKQKAISEGFENPFDALDQVAESFGLNLKKE